MGERTTPKNIGFDIYIYVISSNCCCTHLLADSKVLELFDAPFQTYDGFCPRIDLNIQRKQQGTLTTNANVMTSMYTRNVIYCLHEAYFTQSVVMTVAHEYSTRQHVLACQCQSVETSHFLSLVFSSSMSQTTFSRSLS